MSTSDRLPTPAGRAYGKTQNAESRRRLLGPSRRKEMSDALNFVAEAHVLKDAEELDRICIRP